MLLLLLLVAVCGLNVSFTAWGTNRTPEPLLTVALEQSFGSEFGEPERFGLYCPAFLESTPWIALVLGVMLPLALLGLLMYILVRPRAAAQA